MFICVCALLDESSSVGLPLGVEYEKKKQRLQHELRMDFRRHMGQVTFHTHLTCVSEAHEHMGPVQVGVSIVFFILFF